MIWVYATKDGCVTLDTAYINFIDCHIGIDELSPNEAYRIYPNPAGEFVTVESLKTEDERFSIEVLNMRGESLIRTSGHEHKARVLLNGIPSGLYLLQVNGEAAVYRFRLIRH